MESADVNPLRLEEVFARQRAAHRAAPVPTLEARRARLRALEDLLRRHQLDFAHAISADFGNRSCAETILAEVIGTISGSAHARRHLARWMRPQRRAVAVTFQPARNAVEFAPLGVVGVIAPWNYPLLLTLGPLVDVLAAGNRCMIKPSELTPRTGALLRSLLGEIFAPEEVAVVEGDVSVGRAFCALPFDHLVFTGSTRVGREIMRVAADNLVPLTLELGGKSPVLVAEGFAPEKAAASVAVGKFFNAGQTCTAPDYALVPRSAVEPFAHAVLAAAQSMYPTLSANRDYTTIISADHHARLAAAVAEAEHAGARVLRHPEQCPPASRAFPPTLVLDPPLDGKLMQEEIFGPVLPVVGVRDVDEAIAFVNARPRPLALYAFTRDAAIERRILDQTLSGGVTLNGTMVHVGQADLPFGGVGPSGMGAYHGREGFLRFSHARSVHRTGFVSSFEVLRPPHRLKSRLALKALSGFDMKKT